MTDMNPQSHDVIISSGGRYSKHEGNITFRDYIDERYEFYESLSSIKRKPFAEGIYEEFAIRRGVRFLKPADTGEIEWQMLDKTYVVEVKIMQRFRELRKISKNKNKMKSRSASTASGSRKFNDENVVTKKVVSSPVQAATAKKPPKKSVPKPSVAVMSSSVTIMPPPPPPLPFKCSPLQVKHKSNDSLFDSEFLNKALREDFEVSAQAMQDPTYSKNYDVMLYKNQQSSLDLTSSPGPIPMRPRKDTDYTFDSKVFSDVEHTATPFDDLSILSDQLHQTNIGSSGNLTPLDSYTPIQTVHKSNIPRSRMDTSDTILSSLSDRLLQQATIQGVGSSSEINISSHIPNHFSMSRQRMDTAESALSFDSEFYGYR